MVLNDKCCSASKLVNKIKSTRSFSRFMGPFIKKRYLKRAKISTKTSVLELAIEEGVFVS